MKRELTINTDPIDEAVLTGARTTSDGMGAVISFSGVVRRMEGEDAIEAIDYEAFHEMAEHQFNKLFDEMEDGGPSNPSLVHRIGVVKVNELPLD